MTDPKEYFAETTEALFLRNDLFRSTALSSNDIPKWMNYWLASGDRRS